LKEYSIFGFNPSQYPELQRNVKPENSKSKLSDNYINSLIPDINGNYLLPITDQHSITIKTDPQTGRIELFSNEQQNKLNSKSKIQT
jgi:translation elongation factor EF-Tu-like GTPase